MGWEQRRGRSYYYRNLREGGRVRSEYIGGGTLAELCAEHDGCGRQERAGKKCQVTSGLDDFGRWIGLSSFVPHGEALVPHGTL